MADRSYSASSSTATTMYKFVNNVLQTLVETNAEGGKTFKPFCFKTRETPVEQNRAETNANAKQRMPRAKEKARPFMYCFPPNGTIAHVNYATPPIAKQKKAEATSKTLKKTTKAAATKQKKAEVTSKTLKKTTKAAANARKPKTLANRKTKAAAVAMENATKAVTDAVEKATSANFFHEANVMMDKEANPLPLINQDYVELPVSLEDFPDKGR